MLYLSLAALLISLPADTSRTVHAVRVPVGEAPPTIDGQLDEALWGQASPASDFVQMSPRPGAPATQRTEARVLYDGSAIYVGMRLYDTHPDSIAAQLARRDAVGIHSDWAHVVLDSYRDRRTAFRFSVNPRGVKKDVFHYNDDNEDLSWDAVWDVATRVDSLGWTAEYRIPLSQLRFDVRSGEQQWGVNFGRETARNDERAYWAAVQPSSGRYVSFAGTLAGLQGLRRPERLELQPYVVTRYTRAPGEAANPFYRANDVGAAMGADVKYGVTGDLTLTATLNPDFGQVEADPSEVNLTAFETRFAERRPFFVEGTDIFQLDLGQVDVNGNEQLFYSRRIGRSPQRRPSVNGYVDAPQASTILGAAKLSGKTRDGWAVGVLNAVTQAEQARVFAGGRDSVVAIEPLTNHAMARVTRDFDQGRSTVGGVLTAVNRRIEPGSGLDFLRSEAYVGGLDVRHRFRGGHYQVQGALLASHIGGSRRAIQLAQTSTARLFQRPDAGHVELDTTRTSLQGATANVVLSKIAGGNVRWDLLAATRTPGFEANDLGFQRLADASTLIGSFRYVQPRAGATFRSWMLGADAGSSWTYGGERFVSAVVARGEAQLKNFWRGGTQLVRFLPAHSPTTLRGGPALYTPARNIAVLFLGSDSRRAVRLNGFAAVEREDGTDARTTTVAPEVTFRPSSRASVGVESMLSRNLGAWQYLARRGSGASAEYLGGRLEQTTLALTARVDYSFTPDLSMQLYAQPFVSSGDFGDIRRVHAPRATSFAERFRPASMSGNPDFNVKQFRSNAVLRWEYRPGSTLFVVWSQGREQFLPEGSFAPRRDLGRLFGLDQNFPAPATNVLLIKASYWMGS